MALELKLDLDGRDPINAIIDFCRQKLSRWIKAAGDIKTIDQLEQLVCRKLNLVFEEVWTDEDLERIVDKYVKLGEHVFVQLGDQDRRIRRSRSAGLSDQDGPDYAARRGRYRESPSPR